MLIQSESVCFSEVNISIYSFDNSSIIVYFTNILACPGD